MFALRNIRSQYHPSTRPHRLQNVILRRYPAWNGQSGAPDCLEGKPRTELNFSSRGRSLCDCAKLRRVDKTVWHTKVGMVERVEKLGANLEPCCLRECEIANYGKVQGLHSGPIDRVAASIAKGEGRRRRECCGVEPCRR